MSTQQNRGLWALAFAILVQGAIVFVSVGRVLERVDNLVAVTEKQEHRLTALENRVTDLAIAQGEKGRKN